MAIENRGPELQAVACTLVSVAIVSTLLRCYVRVFKVKSFGFDDWCMVFAVVCGLSSPLPSLSPVTVCERDTCPRFSSFLFVNVSYFENSLANALIIRRPLVFSWLPPWSVFTMALDDITGTSKRLDSNLP